MESGADVEREGGEYQPENRAGAQAPAEGAATASVPAAAGTAPAARPADQAEGAATVADARKIHDEVELPDEEMLYDLADLFKVFADTTRIRILYALMVEDLSVNGIAEAVGGVSQSAVSHQLRILKQAHLVKFRREGKQMIYSLSDDHVYTMLSQGLTHICE